MNTENDWIKMTDRRPTEADLPVWVYDSSGSIKTGAHFMDRVPASDAWTHWRPAKDDMLEPPREGTQEDKDSGAFICWRKFTVAPDSPSAAWHAALAYERAEVAKMLPPKTIHGDTSDHLFAIEAIRARCAGGGK